MRDPDRLPDLPYLSGLPRPHRGTINVANSMDGNTYLHELCRRNAPLALIDDAVRALGADIDRPNAAGWTPLGLAILHGSPVLAQRLLQLGASTKTGDFNALLLAVDANKPDMLFVLLRSPGAGDAINEGGRLSNGRVSFNTPLIVAAEDRRTELYPALVRAGAFINVARRDDGQTPLHIAAAGSDNRAVPLLLGLGADPNAVAEDNWTPLHVAAARGRTDNMQELVAAGARIDAVNRLGESPLMIATQHGHTEAVRVMVAAGATVDLRAAGVDMRTPLMIAARRASSEMVEVLLEAGADPLLQDRFNETAAAQVTRNIHTSLYERLKDEEDMRLRQNFEAAHRRLSQSHPPKPGGPRPR